MTLSNVTKTAVKLALIAGIGFAAMIGMAFLMIYYNMVLGWGFFYFVHSFAVDLPFARCTNAYNSASKKHVFDEKYREIKKIN